MRRHSSLLFLLATVCCLGLTQKANADVYVNSYVDIDRQNGMAYGTVAVSVDYEYGYYYSTQIDATLKAPNQYDHEYLVTSDSYTELQVRLPTYADTEYTVEALYNVKISYNYDSGGYYDYFNYRYWASQYIDAPGSFNFYGPGPPLNSPQSVSKLGKTHGKKRTGVPDHLHVLSDVTFNRPGGCGQVQRNVKFQIADSGHYPVGKLRIMEDFNPKPIIDSCSNTEAPAATCAVDYVNADSTFTDQLSTACPTTGGTCGFIVQPHRWQQCVRPGITRNLSYMSYNVRYSYIEINGSRYLNPGTEIYP